MTGRILEWVQATPFGVPTTVFLAAAILALTLVLERRTPFGRYMYAIGAGEEAAHASGVPIGRYKILAFGLSGAAATAAGALFSARLLGGSPIAGDRFLLLAIAVVVVGGTALTGGTGGIWRTVLGALVMTLMVNGMSILGVDPFVQQVVTGAIVIAAVAATMDRSRSVRDQMSPRQPPPRQWPHSSRSITCARHSRARRRLTASRCTFDRTRSSASSAKTAPANRHC